MIYFMGTRHGLITRQSGQSPHARFNERAEKDTKLELGSQQETKQKADYEDVMAEVLYLINMDIDPEENNVLGNMYNSVWHLLGFVDIEQILVSF